MRNSYYLGIDLGSVSLNLVLLDQQLNVIEESYNYILGKPFQVLYDTLTSLLLKYPPSQIEGIAITGSGGKVAVTLTGGTYVNEVIAQATAVSKLIPEARTIIEIGGEDSKIIQLGKDPGKKFSHLVDFEMNSVCAAGTGSFLDQQAKRIGVSIENEFGRMALQSMNPPRIAGRCSVFAKSDMIHLQQIATPLHDIVAGLCFALARNFKSTIAHGKEISVPVVFSGGVAANAGMVRAFREILGLFDGELVVPKHHASLGAIGAIMYMLGQKDIPQPFQGTDKLKKYIQNDGIQPATLPKLKESSARILKTVQFTLTGVEKIPVYLGLDIGSLSTNLVLITEDHRVVDRRYLPTAGKPLEAIQRGLREMVEATGDKVVVKGAGTTGSGRYLTGDFIGADIVINEISAQAKAAIDYDPSVDTIFEIGGQDSKYISIKNGAVVDFEMNKVCAAGTGSFLEEQADKLNIRINEQFGKLALDCECPAKLGDRCTVFIESDLNSLQQIGVKVDKLAGGLAYAIVNNYLQKVVGSRRIGNHIFFQGGVANNKSVVAAFEQVLGQPVVVPPNFDVTGAIGAAILAQETMQGKEKSRFRGFEMRDTKYTTGRFNCTGCTNHCEISKVVIGDDNRTLFYGGRCEKYEKNEKKNAGPTIPNLFDKRNELLEGDYRTDRNNGKISIGIPRALMLYHQHFPFWRTFFESLGFSVILSDKTNRNIVTASLEKITAELCLPVELIHGHTTNLIEKGVNYIFLPFISNARKKAGNPTSNCNCPWIQSHPFMVKSAIKSIYPADRILSPVLHFRHYNTLLKKELTEFMKLQFGLKTGKVLQAIKMAEKEQNAFEISLQTLGKQVMNNLPQHFIPVILLGRPYNTGDPFLNLGLTDKLIRHKLYPIPLDFFNLNINAIFTHYRSMYWPNGQKILAAAKIITETREVYGVYISNFRCGPDSFIRHYLEEELKGKPCLHLEVDEHSADAGMVTRIEAFIESLRGNSSVECGSEKIYRPRRGPRSPNTERILYFPHMNDHAEAISAAARSCGIRSSVLPLQNAQDLELGRLHTSSRECFPMICTTGSFLKKLREPGVDPAHTSFFMPDHNGPCRFGQYNHLQRIIFDKLGYDKVEIVSPSNDSSYADIAGKAAPKFRLNAWKGFVAVDFLRTLKQETRPYEIYRGDTERAYRLALSRVIQCIENGTRGLHSVLKKSVDDFNRIALDKPVRKPVVGIVGEIFMRDNDFCNGGMISRLEDLGVETIIAPFSEWITYSTYRYKRDSLWNKDWKGYLRAQMQSVFQNATSKLIIGDLLKLTDYRKIPHLEQILSMCAPYVHRDYDGDPPLAMGSSVFFSNHGISGIVAILPFTCMPGTLIAAVSDSFRKDHHNIPWINVAYDGQETLSIDTRLQAFVHQVKEFHFQRQPELLSKQNPM